MPFCWPLDTFIQGLFLSLSPMLVLKEGKGFCLEAEGKSWCSPKVPYKWSLLLSRIKGEIELV